MRVNGRTATVTLGKGTVDVSPGRRLTVSNGVFEVPNTRLKAPPARVRLPGRGPVPAAAELLALDRLREFSGAPFDPGGDARQLVAPDQSRDAVAARSAAGLDRLQHRGRSYELQRREDGVRPKGRSPDAAGDRQQPANTRSRATSRSRGTPAQIEYRKTARARPSAEVKAAGDARRSGAGAAWPRCRHRAHRRAAGEAQRARRRRTTGRAASTSRPTSRRRRSKICCRAGSSRRGGRRALASRWSRTSPATRLRRSADRRAGRPRQGHRRTRQQRRAAGCELSGVCDLRRRQDDAEGRPRRRRRAARRDARRRL